MAHPLPSLARAAVAGLTLGLVGAAFVLLWSAHNHLSTPCEFPGTPECDMELSTGEDLAKLQAAAATGCGLVAGGLYLLTRRKEPSA